MGTVKMTGNKTTTTKNPTARKKTDKIFMVTAEACTEIENFLQSNEPELPKGRFEQLKELVAETVRAAGETPDLTELTAKFETLCKKYADHVHCLYQARDLARWEHYTCKLDLCEQVKKLAECADQDLPRVARELKLIRLRWKDIGSVPHEKNEEIWQEFSTRCDNLQARITEYYNGLEEKRKLIYVEKIAICEEAEKMQYSTDWENDAQKFKDLQKKWRQAGFTAPEQEKELYLRFRAACDIFFNARKEYYRQAKAEREDVTGIKSQLCEEAKRIFTLSYSEAHQLIPNLWARWKAAGSAGKNDRELYERFRGYFDTYYEGLRKERSENLRIKKELCEKLSILKEAVESGKKQFEDINPEYSEIKKQWNSTGAMPRAEEQPVIEAYFRLIGELNTLASQSESAQKEILKRSFELEKIVSAALDSLDSKKMDTWEQCQSKWSALDWTEKKYFRDSFDDISAAFMDDPDEHYKQLLNTSNHNLEKREKICAELERLGIKPEEDATDEDLAEELTQAIVNNFGSGARDRNLNLQVEEVDDLVKRWLKAGVVPLKDLPRLYKRFEHAMKTVNQLKE